MKGRAARFLLAAPDKRARHLLPCEVKHEVLVTLPSSAPPSFLLFLLSSSSPTPVNPARAGVRGDLGTAGNRRTLHTRAAHLTHTHESLKLKCSQTRQHKCKRISGGEERDGSAGVTLPTKDDANVHAGGSPQPEFPLPGPLATSSFCCSLNICFDNVLMGNEFT